MPSSRYDHITDAELLDLYSRDQNQEWIGILLERYTLLLLGVCMKYMRDEQEARDCVQQIYLKVLTEISRHKVEYFKSWLYMVAKNYCLMRLRSRQGKIVGEVSEQMPEPAQAPKKEELLEHEHTYELLEESLKELNDEQRQSVILFYLQKNSYTQISEKTGFSLMQVKSYIQNGKRNLRNILERKLKQRQERKS